ncbi:hypothetical protein jhhlp_007012 [Lomentospora prolificans]|uniref:Increased loss of mitochondrial DNA protein 1 n=1 Tax=Lomentospora prolificans TaxID=41688 RepID=A0A2N3N1G1_9PEZI|nr:hypothetical protein jhhlp_007012 [Lomentospora prolificans]
MALISARTIITSISLFHITLGFFFLTNPATIADQAIVYVMGEAMGMPYARSFESQSPPLAFLAVVLATMGISDLVSLGLPEERPSASQWPSLSTFTLSCSRPLRRYTTRTPAAAYPPAHAQNPAYRASPWGGDGLKNRVFFTFMFVELVSWLWVWVTLREERAQALSKQARKRNHEL